MSGVELTGLVPDPDGEPRADWDPRLATVTGEPATLHGRLEMLDPDRARFYRVWARGLLAESVLWS